MLTLPNLEISTLPNLEISTLPDLEHEGCHCTGNPRSKWLRAATARATPQVEGGGWALGGFGMGGFRRAVSDWAVSLCQAVPGCGRFRVVWRFRRFRRVGGWRFLQNACFPQECHQVSKSCASRSRALDGRDALSAVGCAALLPRRAGASLSCPSCPASRGGSSGAELPAHLGLHGEQHVGQVADNLGAACCWLVLRQRCMSRIRSCSQAQKKAASHAARAIRASCILSAH